VRLGKKNVLFLIIWVLYKFHIICEIFYRFICEKYCRGRNYKKYCTEITVGDSWGDRKVLSSRDNSWGDRKVLSSRDNSRGDRTVLSSRDYSWGDRKVLASRDNSCGDRKVLSSSDLINKDSIDVIFFHNVVDRSVYTFSLTTKCHFIDRSTALCGRQSMTAQIHAHQ